MDDSTELIELCTGCQTTQINYDNFTHNNISSYNSCNYSDYDFSCLNDTTGPWMDPSFYAIPYRIIGTIFQGFIFIIGVLGNIMVVIVVTRTRSMKTPTNCYLVSLSIADLLVLIASVPNEIIAYYLIGDKWIWGPIGCGLFIFLQYLGINASSLSITAFTIERYIAICHPMRAQKMCTVHRAKRIITGVWIFAFIYCSPWLFLTKTEVIYYKGYDDIETCTFALSRQHYKVYFFADLILFYVFPLLLSCVLYGLIAKILFNNELTKSTSSSHDSGNSHGKSRNGHAHSNVIADSKKSSNQSADQARVQVVKMLIVVVAVFATLWLPYRAMVVYNSFAEKRYMELWYLMFSKTTIFVNSAINPIIYSACSMKFRRAFKRMLTCDRRSSNGHQTGPRSGQYNTIGLSTTMHTQHLCVQNRHQNQAHQSSHSSQSSNALRTTSNLTLSNL